MEYRIEKDTMGEVKVPADKYWGAQTERSRNNFKIGPEASMPLEVVYGFAYLKKAAAHTNCALGVMTEEKRDLISAVCDEILEGKLDDQFPLVVWQTGSGTRPRCTALATDPGTLAPGPGPGDRALETGAEEDPKPQS